MFREGMRTLILCLLLNNSEDASLGIRHTQSCDFSRHGCMEVTVDLGHSSLLNAETKLISYFVEDLISSWDVDFICLQILWLWICYGSIAANMNLLIAAALLRAFYGYEKKLLEANSVLHSYVGTLVEEATRKPTSHKFLWMNGWYTGQRSSV